MINKLFLSFFITTILLFSSMIIFVSTYDKDVNQKQIQSFTQLTNISTLSLGYNYMHDRFNRVNESHSRLYPLVKDSNYMEFIYDK